jgi:CHAT domain-containing protein
VQGFPALPYVREEVASIQRLYGGTVLRDEDYSLRNVEAELSRRAYGVVHIASHAQFRSDLDQTFLLAYDDKLTMDRLQALMGLSRYRDRPVDLLTLSACQTAVGDERAALGLAGLAVKAGARSALATLWYVSDQASAQLVAEFYRQIKEGTGSKAQALQQAQLRLLADARYQHPGYWAPFLLIGNWL